MTAAPPERRQSVRLVATGCLVYGGAAMLLVLGFDSLPGVRAVQIAPWSDVLGLALLPVAWLAGRAPGSTPIRRAVFAFAGFALLHSLVALAIEGLAGGLTAVRVLAWTRQVAALAAGLAVYLSARASIRALGERRTLQFMLLGAIPSLALAGVSIVASLSGSAAPFDFERRVRLLFVPLGFTWHGRASGFSIEPSFLAFFLAVTALPAAVALAVSGRGRARVRAGVALVGSTLALIATFSATGFAVVAAMLTGAILTRWRRVAIWATAAIVVGILALVAWLPQNYLSRRVLEGAEGYGYGGVRDMDVSVVNTLAGAVGPFLRTTSSFVALGYGLGGTATHLDEMLPAGWGRGVRQVSWAGMPNLRSLTGRVFAETGVLGLALFVAIFHVAARTFMRGAPVTPIASTLRWMGPLVLLGLFVGLALKYGSFATPYLWVWLALADEVPRKPVLPVVPAPVTEVRVAVGTGR